MKTRGVEVVMHGVMPFRQRVCLMLATGRWPVKGTYYEGGLHGNMWGLMSLVEGTNIEELINVSWVLAMLILYYFLLCDEGVDK